MSMKPVTNVMMIDPQSAVQKPSTEKPTSNASAISDVSSSISALITSRNRPMVRMMNGSDSTFTIGSTNIVTRPRISATISSGQILSCQSAPLIRMPSKPGRHGDCSALVNSHVTNLTRSA